MTTFLSKELHADLTRAQKDKKVKKSRLRVEFDGALVPATDNDVDLGTSSAEFKNAYFDGTVTSDAFAGPLTGDVTGNVSGSAATVTGAAQSAITSLGTLTTLTVDDITINGATISKFSGNANPESKTSGNPKSCAVAMPLNAIRITSTYKA